jgi:hypothetical protein
MTLAVGLKVDGLKRQRKKIAGSWRVSVTLTVCLIQMDLCRSYSD